VNKTYLTVALLLAHSEIDGNTIAYALEADPYGNFDVVAYSWTYPDGFVWAVGGNWEESKKEAELLARGGRNSEIERVLYDWITL
jgi:hypothetical protein